MGTLDHVTPGQIVTFTGFGANLNPQWEIFDTTTAGAKLGTSSFHTSCSDVNMNGSEDCDQNEGDNKGLTGFINDWVFKGMVGALGAPECDPLVPPPTNTCEVQNTPVDCTTEGKPTSLTFRYTDGGCAASNNQQPVPTKFECTDTGFNLQISRITVSTWPAANGLLDQAKLDAAKIADPNPDLSAPAVMTTFTGTAKDRTIDHNKSKTLKLVFKNKAVIGVYTIKVEFTNGCSVSFP